LRTGFDFSRPHKSVIRQAHEPSEGLLFRMIRWGAKDIRARAKKTGYYNFPATGATEYLKNGGKLEMAQQKAYHESASTRGS